VRRLPQWAFGGLVAATVAAFFVTQALKVTTPVINGNISPPGAFSPTAAGCQQTSTHTSFYLQHREDDVDVYVIDQGGTIVRTVATSRHMRKNVRIPDGVFTWNGRDDNGRLAPDGTYYFRVGLRQQGRTIDLSKYPIILKTVAPHPVVTRVENQLLPQGNTKATIHYAGNGGRGGTIRVYRTDVNPAKPQLVHSFPTPFGKGSTVQWDGKISGRPAPAGVYLIGLDVTDITLCNTGHFPPIIPPTRGATQHAGVTVRYLAAQPPAYPVPAGTKAIVYVDSRHQPYQWALRRQGASRPTIATGRASGNPDLRVPIPRGGVGLYELAVRAGAYRTEVPIVVRASPPKHGGILVVLPALTWLGQNPADEDGDGMPDTLDAGDPVNLARPFANGLPQGFGDEAAFLAYLDGAHLPYDLTTDLALTPQILASHTGVVLAGSERWIPGALGPALKTYVERGGRVLTLGIDSLRRTVTVRSGSAENPGPSRPTDVFGAQIGDVVPHTADRILQISDDLGIFSGLSGTFQGFSSYEPVAPAVAGQPVASAAGTSATTPAVVGFRLGGGLVIKAGLPGFGAKIVHNIDAQEFTRGMWAILSR
jgi:hypothetical protein